MVHGQALAPGFAKVNVDGVHVNFEVVPLPKPPNDEIMTLGQAIGTFIQWPKSDISLESSSPVAGPEQHALVPSPLQDQSVPPPDTAPVLSPRVLFSPEQLAPLLPSKSTAVKSSYSRGSKASKGKANKTNDDIPYAPLARKFVLGQPLLEEKYLQKLPYTCMQLHMWYMQQSNKLEGERTSSITVKFTEEDLHHSFQECMFVVAFEDLFDLFTFNALDVSIIRCWTL